MNATLETILANGLSTGLSTCLKPVARGVLLLLLSASMAVPAYAFDGADGVNGMGADMPRTASAAKPAERSTVKAGEGESAAGYVARKDGLRTFFNALSARLKKPVIVSQKASRKQISGDFDLARPQALLEAISIQLGLIWYHDGQTVYIYDASEMRNAMVALPNGSLSALNEFLRKAGLYDRRYPLRDGGSNGLFYVAGPPVYIELVANATRFLGKNGGGALGKLRVEVVRLENTFVTDRNMTVRDNAVTVPGIATVIEQLLRDEQMDVEVRIEDQYAKAESAQNAQHAQNMQRAQAPGLPADMPIFPAEGGVQAQPVQPYPPPMSKPLPPLGPVPAAPAEKIRVIAYRDTNSLLIRGTQEQVDFVKNLIARLDIAKRHIELSLWIIDLKKGDLDQIGVNWSGGVSLGSKVGATFNNAISTLDGAGFVAAIHALEKNEKSRIVSRPVVLTQENVPALFDNNQTVYTKLLAERMVQMEKVTFGTMISVLPRFAQDGEIEMSLTIEDGSQLGADGHAASDINVSRTHISTVARVPKGMSLLIGGYTRDVKTDTVDKIPLLGDLPGIGALFRSRKIREDSLVRVFLIQPKQIETPLPRDAGDLGDDLLADRPQDPQQKLLRDFMERKHGID
ncbi:EscC/YscC/HrcC family type III secretion system outer membrane ring protein [Oxalobacteraceae bacterium CAVE-383]|nr:EscC/YscC/HrcC family type III secretion system outer membrane ring protein [Oxalobacteraceae bacterium CAVE-383]